MFETPIKSAVLITCAALACGTFLSRTISSNQPASVANSATTQAPRIATLDGSDPSHAYPPRLPSNGYGKVELRSDSGGQYRVGVEVDGRQIPMMVDTGATYLTLTYADAQRLGVAPAPADYVVDVMTANGSIRAARATLREVRLETLRITDVSALVLPRGINGMSLLGMSFLKRLGGLEVASGTMVLRP